MKKKHNIKIPNSADLLVTCITIPTAVLMRFLIEYQMNKCFWTRLQEI